MSPTARALRVGRRQGTWWCRGLAVLGVLAGCKSKVDSAPVAEASKAPPPGAALEPPAKPAGPEPKKGMAFIPAGSLIAGSPLDSTAPRIADEELPGVETPMQGFYIDLYPYPNEPGAIPTANVSRAEAEKLCEGQGKRLCSELEWERACKGESNTTYESGNTYRSATCGTGVAAELAASRPNGEHPACKSSFGVQDMHGSVWEWTSSTWAGRKANEHGMGVLRGGNATAGELVARCANSLARPLTSKAATIGFRCCAGEPNEAEVQLELSHRAAWERIGTPTATTADITRQPRQLWGAKEPFNTEFYRAWHWRPVPNEDLVVSSGCEKKRGDDRRCGVVVLRVADDEARTATVLADLPTGPRIPDLIVGNDPTKIRARSMDIRGTFARDFSYVVGKVVVAADEIRP